MKRLDPAERLLELKICDPAMGSGHFLVNLVDYLSDRVITAMADAEAAWDGYISPLNERIENIRNSIAANADDRGWTVDPAQLDDRRIVRRMVLKRCVYGVDKNPMAVELAKVSLWLHTFTVGAPLSFLDHHLRCGDSLFGSWVRPAIERAEEHGVVFLRAPLTRATRAAAPMQIIEGLTDAEIAEAHRSADVFAEVSEMTAPLDGFLSVFLAFDWLRLRDRDDVAAFKSWLAGVFGDPIRVASGQFEAPAKTEPHAQRFSDLLATARHLVASQRFLNWQVAFPGVWSDWEESGLHGGFDAVIGNPPWDRMKLQQIEWFAARRREIAMAPRASDRKRLIADLKEADDPLAREYAQASDDASVAVRMARTGGDYPLLSGGDVNLGRPRYDAPPFFPDVHKSFKFCVFVASPSPTEKPASCGFFLRDVSELEDANRRFPLTAAEFARVNPNTGTAPIFRSRRDAELTAAIYGRLPVLVDRSSGEPVKAWPVKYATMFHMTNDSGLFRTRAELEDTEGAWPIGSNRFNSPSGEWVPLYVGRMIHQFDHRAASVTVNADNLHNPALSGDISDEQKADPAFVPTPQYWVRASDVSFAGDHGWTLAFRDIARATDARTLIAASVPLAGLGNKAPTILFEGPEPDRPNAALLLANLNATILDFVVRQKVHSTNLNRYIVEQLPVIPPGIYDTARFGPRTATEIVREAVLELTYTAHDMAPFATGLGHVNSVGEVMPPFPWDEDRRLRLRAKLDALYFHLYGVTDRDDIRHVYSTFPIVERQEQLAYGRYLSRDLCLAWINALAAGDPDANVDL